MRNGKANTYVKGTATDGDGSGGVYAAGRGSRLTFSSEKNVGRSLIVRKSTGLGSLEIYQKYVEGNGDGMLIDEYEKDYQQLVIKGNFNHPGNASVAGTASADPLDYRVFKLGDGATTVYKLLGAAGKTVNDIEVYVGGVKLTPTTQYTVATNINDLDVTMAVAPALNAVVHIKDYSGVNKPQDFTIVATTTDGGPVGAGAWLRIEDMQPHSTITTGGIVVKSNTYRYRMSGVPHGVVSFTNRPPTPEGAFASGFISWNGTSVSHRSDAQTVGRLTLTRTGVGIAKLTFPPELVQYGSGGTLVQNYQLNLQMGGSTFRYLFIVGTAATTSVEIRCFDSTAAWALADTASNTLFKYTLTRIDE